METTNPFDPRRSKILVPASEKIKKKKSKKRKMRNHEGNTKLLISRNYINQKFQRLVLFMHSYRPRENLRGKTETRKP